MEPGKLCDNCGKCIEDSSDYKEILIDEILKEKDYSKEEQDFVRKRLTFSFCSDTICYSMKLYAGWRTILYVAKKSHNKYAV